MEPSVIGLRLTVGRTRDSRSDGTVEGEADQMFGRMRAQWRALHVDDASIDSTLTKEQQAAESRLLEDGRRRIAEEARAASAGMSPGDDYLWEDARLDEHASFAISRSFDRLYRMALGWATPGTPTFGSKRLLADTIAGLDWMVEQLYRPDGQIIGNWYEWQIAGPLALNDAAVLVYDSLSPEQLAAYAAATAHYVPSVWSTSANRAMLAAVVVGRGVLTSDADVVAMGAGGLSSVLEYATAGDGFYTDGSFVMHDYFPYTGSYGISLLGTLPSIVRTVAGTPWEISSPIIYDWIRESFDPLVWRGALMDFVAGRTVSRYDQQDHDHGHEVLAAALGLLPSAPPEVFEWLAPLVKEWTLSDTLHDAGCQLHNRRLPLLRTAFRLISDQSISRRGPLEVSKVFGKMARVVHRRENWALAISMFSREIRTNESINDENLRGSLVDNGATYLYTDQADHFSGGWWPTVDPNRIPGITVDPRPRADGEGASYANPHDWVGGATLDGRYTAAGMRLSADGSSLQAYKSWFCFDREIVAMGAGITATDGRTVETIVENRRVSKGDEVVLVDGRQVVLGEGTETLPNGINWVHIEGAGGYVFGNAWEGTVGLPTRVLVCRQTRSGRWSDINQHPVWRLEEPLSRSYLTLWLDQGVDPVDAEYIYTMLPAANEVETAMYARRLTTAVVDNGTEVHGVRELDSGVLGVNAWVPASSSIVHCESPASVVLQEGPTELSIAVSDPTQQESRVRVRLDITATKVVVCDEEITVSSLDPVVLDVDVEGLGGASRQVRLAYRPWSVGDLRAMLSLLRDSGEVDAKTASELDAELVAVGDAATAGGAAGGLVWSFRAQLKTRRGRGLSYFVAFDALDDGAQRLLARVPA